MATTLGTKPGRGWLPFAVPNLGDRVFREICRAAGLVVIGIFALLVVVLIVKSWESITTFGPRFFTDATWNPVEDRREFGALAFIYGTLMTSFIAMVIAVPLGVGTAAYLSEIAPAWVRRIASFMVEMLAAIPSVVYGFWGVFVLAPMLSPIISGLGGPSTGGVGIFSAGLILSVMIIPYVTAVSYDVCRAVPRSQRDGALALGATRWQTIWSVVIPYARPGIIGACFLALGRAIGETMAVTMLIGNKAVIEWSPLALGNSIASAIANEFQEATYDLYISALTELGLVLLVVSMFVNALARILVWRVTKAGKINDARHSGSSSINPAWTRVREGISPVLLLLIAGYVADWFARGIFARVEFPARAITIVAYSLFFAMLIFGTGALIRAVTDTYAGFARIINSLMTGVLAMCTLTTVIPLLVILGYIVARGVGAINWSFFTNLPAPVGEPGGGMANAIYGSAMLVGLASLFAIPVGLFAAIYLSENRNSRLGSLIRFIGELLSGVPSIVIGLFAYAVVVRPMGHFSGWAGAFALGVMMIPIVMRASEESLKLVPTSIRNASYALGASQWQTVSHVIVPAALSAIITGVFLAIARIAGETAPLMLTAGNNNFFPSSPSDFTPSIPYFIYNYAISPYADWHRQAWSAALVLLVLVMGLNFGIRFLTGRRVVLASRAD